MKRVQISLLVVEHGMSDAEIKEELKLGLEDFQDDTPLEFKDIAVSIGEEG